MPALPDAETLLLAAAAAGAAIGLALLAAALLAQGAEEGDLGRRLQSVLQPELQGAAAPRAGAGLGARLARPLLWLGQMLRDSAVVSPKEIEEFARAMTAAGLDARRAVPFFLGAKVVALVALPLGGLGLAWLRDYDGMDTILAGIGGLVLGVLGPNWVLGGLRRPYQERLRRGLPDALDLLVVGAEAGLALETALDRVAREMEGSNRAIAGELNTLLQELRMLPDRRMALERMAERTDLEGFKRLGSTLSQTLRYGTPLAQALRVLAAEMRQERMLRLEEKAIRLPAMLIAPLILFILPALFIALLGPSILEIGKSFGG
ncbi:type II secretion system F family protein [Belnapia sp. T6]|uniref:Type II secretion system F family protein n=1 Tax=Belnapia mucosa TaxID=2804532 RepID=A0ABS1V7L7_9PROT|nr:type II secretion system F family protein [Belnapia mucosa]MBL6457161.1 type II secretion system F family protein [Belnapia mucosa]